MKPIKFPEANICLGKPEEMSDDECKSLFAFNTGDSFISCWVPDIEERKLIAKGSPVWLCIVGKGHPPVSITVDDPFPRNKA